MSARIWIRKTHYWISAVIAVPLIVVIVSGLLLQLKKQISWVQPPSKRGKQAAPGLSFARILERAKSVPEAGIKSWKDIDRLDVRPARGIIKIRAHNRWEVQIDHSSGAILQVAYRRSDLIESLHDGSFFQAKLWLFLPAAAGLLALWISGLYLFALPILGRRRRRARQALKATAAAG